MPNKIVSQLSLFGNSDDSGNTSNNNAPQKDKRPLPLIIADKWGFPLQYYEKDSEYYFAVQDWFRGLLQRQNVSSYINGFKNANPETYRTSIGLEYLASDSKTYIRDFCTDVTLYLIAQSLNARNPLGKVIADYMANASSKFDRYRRDESLAIQDAVKSFESEGKSQSWIEARAQGIITRKQFIEALKNAVLNADASLYAQSTEKIYKALWDRTTAQLRSDLEISKHENPRNHFGEYALVYTRLAEMYAITRLGDAEIVSVDVAMSIVYESAKLIKPQALATAQALGVDLVTGKPLLTSGQ